MINETRLEELKKKIPNPHLRYYVLAAEGLEIEYTLPSAHIGLFKGEKRNFSVSGAETDLNGVVSKKLAMSKSLTHKILSENGIPVPYQKTLSTEKMALEFKKEVDNIVIKPAKGVGGKGITLLPETEEDVIQAYKLAADSYDTLASSKKILGEEYFHGNHYRILVLGDKVIGVVHRRPAYVIGDGHSTIEQLIAKTNKERANEGMMKIAIDSSTLLTLKLEGKTMDDIPSENEEVNVRLNTNLSTGGTCEECMGIVDPYYLGLAVKATKVLGLRLGGVDLMTQNISDSQAAHAINEVNHHPGLRLHYKVDKGDIVDVATEIMAYMRESSKA